MAVSDKDSTVELRKRCIQKAKRVVVKVGSGVLTTENGLNTRVVNSLTREICDLKRSGIQVILVSSGAIASGLKKTGMARRPRSISHQQALAAIGQSSLMMSYEKAFGRHGQKVAQILITRDDLNHRGRYLNARNTIFTLLSWDVVPIINENDTVVVDEIKFGDNDNLSAMVTNLTGAGLLINLTNIDGLFDKDPRIDKDARLIRFVGRLNKEMREYANNIPGFLGRGGMASKIRSAQKVSLGGAPAVIANGLKPGILKKIFSGEDEGTFFLPQSEIICSRKHWIAFGRSQKGQIVLDRGAERALVENCKSLLPSGIKDVKGRFSAGDSVVLVSEDGLELAVGMVNYNSADIRKILGLKSSQIEAVLGFKNEDEVVHRDNLVVTCGLEEDN